MRINPIASPLPGEHLAATFPVIRPETDDARWRLRLNFWAGRALTAEALELDQENRAARLAWRGRVATAGIVSGLEVALEAPSTLPTTENPAGHFIHVLPGYGVMTGGEDVVVSRPLRVALDEIPVHYVRIGGPDHGDPAEPAPDGAEAGRPIDAGGFVFAVDSFPDDYTGWMTAVLVLCPAEVPMFARVDPEDPCELDPSRDAFADERRLDAAVLRLCQIPAQWVSRPELSDRADGRWRNRLAHVVFDEETRGAAREQIRFLSAQPEGQRWDTVSRSGIVFPWEVLGVPLALVSSETIEGPAIRYFLDRASVARPGGLALPRTRPAVRLATSVSEAALDPPGAGTAQTWRARVDQFAEHIGQFEAQTFTDVEALALHFQFVPPVGLLPRVALDFLTTAEAMALPPRADQPPDRAGTNFFFPPSLGVEAVPVAVEDLDAALAASAPLAPYDLTSGPSDGVRLLVPLPQRVFDPRLLVVELEDPIFAATVARFIATRQDWRQRRDGVRQRRNTLQGLTAGPQTVPPLPDVDPGQLEPEPVETSAAFTAAGFTRALMSPTITPGPWEATVTVEGRSVAQSATLFVRLRLDQDALPRRIDVRWHSGTAEFPYSWTDPPTPPAPPTDENGDAVATPLWFRFTVTGAQLGINGETIDGFTVHLEDGHVALASAGQLVRNESGELDEDVWWSAQDPEQTPQFTSGNWTPITGNQLVATFEEEFRAAFPDGRTEQQRIDEVNATLNPAGATARAVPMSVDTHGLDRALAELEAEASQADDFIDTYFTRAQVNLYRIRKLVLGQTAAQKLLINPAIAVIAEQETASASGVQFSSFITQAKARAVSATSVNAVLNPPAVTSITPNSARQGQTISATIAGQNLNAVTAVTFSGTGVTATIQGRTTTSITVSIVVAGNAALGARSVTVAIDTATSDPFTGFTIQAPATSATGGFGFAGFGFTNPFTAFASPVTGVSSFGGLSADLGFIGAISGATGGATGTLQQARTITSIELKAATLKDVLGELPEAGPTLPPRGLSIGQRFVEPPATKNLSYARAALVQFLDQLPRVRMPLVGQTVRSISGRDVSLLELQGRAVPSGGNTTDALRTAAINQLLTVTPLSADTDEAEVTLAALDFTEVKSAILRTIERVAQQQRAVAQTGAETLRLLIEQRETAAGRLLVIEGRLAEARHDVAVSRALRQEEQQRLAAINDRRDALIRDEVRFLAYVRPRAVDPVRRNLPYWKIEPLDVAAPVPACLQRHDEPPPPLQAYIELFRHSPARWFTSLKPLLAKLDTSEKLVAVLDTARVSALSFAALDTSAAIRSSSNAVQVTVLGAHSAIATLRQRSTTIQVDARTQRWQDIRRDVEAHASVGDLIAGRHRSRDVSAAAVAELESIASVGTCLHAEFAAVAPAIRLVWIERFSQFDRPASFRDLTVLPQYGRLDRSARRRLQAFADWLFNRVNTAERDAVSLINDLIRLCLLLASHAPVNRIISGHVPRPTPVRPGIQIPIKPLNPELVRVGMEFHVWQASRVVARGRVEDLQESEVTARVEKVDAQTTTLDSSMRVQFVAAGLSLIR